MILSCDMIRLDSQLERALAKNDPLASAVAVATIAAEIAAAGGLYGIDEHDRSPAEIAQTSVTIAQQIVETVRFKLQNGSFDSNRQAE